MDKTALRKQMLQLRSQLKPKFLENSAKRMGGRIGYGKGYYDRFLPQLRADVPKLGLAYDFQVLPRVPQDEFDIRMDAIVTEKGILTMRGSKLL